jgi:hypothetical protein
VSGDNNIDTRFEAIIVNWRVQGDNNIDIRVQAIIINYGVCPGDKNIDITRPKAIIIKCAVCQAIIIMISPGSRR